MKLTIFLLAAVILLVAVQESQGLTCRTGFLKRYCNTCGCNQNTGEVTYCSLVGCPSEPKCTSGDTKMEDGTTCECENEAWYCDVEAKKID